MTAPAEAALDVDLDAEVVCAKKRCDAAAEWRVKAHLPNMRHAPELGCRTGTVNLCTPHKEELLTPGEIVGWGTCSCGKPIRCLSDFILDVRPI